MEATKALEYLKTISPVRIKLAEVSPEYRGFVEAYKASYDSNMNPIDAHRNAIQAAKLKFSPMPEKKGNCPKCGGTGIIRAFGHVKGGACFKCNGSGVKK